MISLGSPADEEQVQTDRACIEQLVKDQYSAWNKGDLSSFLSGTSYMTVSPAERHESTLGDGADR